MSKKLFVQKHSVTARRLVAVGHVFDVIHVNG